MLLLFHLDQVNKTTTNKLLGDETSSSIKDVTITTAPPNGFN